MIQGLTEFLPVSSTAHLLIAERLLGYDDPGGVFTVMIQLGSVLAVMESDRNGGSFRPLQSALVGEWEITPGLAVTGSRTLTLPLEE